MCRLFISLLIVFSFFNLQVLNAQSSLCTDTTEIYLDMNGQGEFSSEDVFLDTMQFDSFALDQSGFDCSDLGFRSIGVSFFSNDSLIDSCQSAFHVIDSIAPVIELTNIQYIYMEAEDTVHLSISNFEGEFYENCTIDTIILSKSTFDSSHVADSLVQITIRDQSGNQSSHEVEVRVQIIDCENEDFTCKNQFYVNLREGDVQLSGADLISEEIKNCDLSTAIDWFDAQGNSLQIQNNIITEDYLNSTLTAVVTNAISVESCTSKVHVESCYPTLESKIGWPEDFELKFSCSVDTQPNLDYLSPAVLQEYFNIDSSLITVGFDSFCHFQSNFLFATYEDHIINADSVQKIIRTWTVFNWYDGKTYTHPQLIKVYPGLTFSPLLMCPNERLFQIGREQYRVINKEFILNDRAYLICDSLQMSFLDMDMNPIQFQANKIPRDYKDPFFYTVLESVHTQESCTTKVNIATKPLSCYQKFNICDQLPYGQNFDDCDSSYSTTDNIEWPRDITVSLCSGAISDATPEYLKSQNGINEKDAYPEVVLEGCEPIHVSVNYRDSFPDDGTQIFPQRIFRSWNVSVSSDADGPIQSSWSYDQLITIAETDTCDHVFLVRTGSGLAVPNVEIGNGYVSGQNGIIDLENYPFDSIKPVFTDTSMVSDIYIEDFRLLNHALSNEIYLTPIQRIAADVNLNGQVDEDDLELLYNYVFDDVPLQKEWAFVHLDSLNMKMEGHFQVPSFNEKSAYTSSENAYEYLAIRIGDLDQSTQMQLEEVNDTLALHVDNVQLKANESLEVPVSFIEDIPLLSLQFSVHFDPDYLQFTGIEGDDNNIDASNYNLLNDSTLLFLWNEGNFRAVARGTKEQATLNPFMNLSFLVLQDGNLCDRIALDTTELTEEAVFFDNTFRTTIATLSLDCEGQVTYSSHPEGPEFKIYPNPAHDQLHIQWNDHTVSSGYTYKILSSRGVVMHIQKAQRLNAISLQEIPSGVYWLEIMEEGKAATVKKFVVQK